jgi:AAA15 family ATPase/GTPase
MEPNDLKQITGDFNNTPLILTPGPHGEPLLVSLLPLHRAAGGHSVKFEMWEESEGTQRLIHLLSFLFALKKGPEQVFVVDELDRRLHPLLSRLLIQTILAAEDRGRHNQIIFTTHDTNLLDLDLLRRDEIWFAEKDAGGASHLYSLAEFRTRADLKIEKGYLNGRFGAIPFIGDVHRLDEAAPEDGAAREQELAAA